MNESTKYEVCLFGPHPQGPLLVCYVTGNSRSALVRVMREPSRLRHLDRITASGKWVAGERASDGITIGKDWLCKFSGRTKRDAKDNERPFIMDVEGGVAE